MTVVAEPEVLVLRRSVQLPLGVLTAADLSSIDLDDVPFEIQDGALAIMPPPSVWHADTAFNMQVYLRPRYPAVTADVDLVVAENLRRPDIVGLSVPLREMLRARMTKPTLQMVELAVEIISHDRNAAKDRISVRRDREVKFREYAAAGIPEYWIVDEVLDDPEDASVEMYRLKDGAYGLVRTVRLSELLSEESEKSA